MSRFTRVVATFLAASALLLTIPAGAGSQRQAVPRQPPHQAVPRQERAPAVRGYVFIGGYFYDPMFGPYPWWPRMAYPYRYVPVYDRRAEVRLLVEPKQANEAAVYVDGFYAGIVRDFDGVFEGLPLTPGGHTIVLYLDGYRTDRRNIYLRPGSTFKLRVTLERLPAGEPSAPPDVAPPLPAPPSGTYRPPVTPPAGPVRSAAPASLQAAGFGTLDLFVQPASAEVTIDGQRWLTSDAGHFVLQLPAGRHHLEIKKQNYRQLVTDVDIVERQTVSIYVSLSDWAS